MTLELAVRLAEIVLGFAIFQQSLEFMRGQAPEKTLGLVRAGLAIVLMLGLQPLLVESALLVTAVMLIWRFQGPYNGGSDTMTVLVLLCLWLSHLAPTRYWQEIALGYLAIQLTLSYFQSGWVKVINPEWRSGRALQQVFALSAYPVSEAVRMWAGRPQVMLFMSWSVIVFELLFPLALLNQTLLITALGIAAVFHLANACLFGLNRFFWIWPAAYTVIIWFQARLLAAF
ncbi:HTTM domain-containing protein [Cellvibrio sp. OA-2007]|uniref:HTTM domain-containing protein n=1 Tax=Cellvibrio sp. OA-2007 TaxID=529823 RepID=UPI000782EECF|nr:HTTM domain-containing protein [Cellvibrio sp. OA-2007]